MKSRPRVLSIGHSYIVSSNRSIMRSVAQLNMFDIDLVAPSFLHGSLRSLSVEPEESDLINVIPLQVSMSKYIHFMYYRGLDKVLAEGRYDLVHIWEEPYIFAGYQIARLCKKREIPFFFRSAQSLNKRYPPPFSYFEKYVVKHCRGWNAGAGLVYQNLQKRGYPKELGVIINLATDKKMFYPDDKKRQEIREQFKLDGFVIGFSGRLVEAKGLDILMSAIDMLDDSVQKKCSLLILGSGPYREKILNWAHKKKIENKVHIHLAKHDEMPQFMRAMDCLVAPSQTTASWKEQFGRMITEAFASHVPVIGSSSGEIPYVIEDAGIVVDEKDVEGWSQAIKSLIESPQLCQNFKVKGYQRFLNRYEVSQVAAQYSRFYQKIIDSKGFDSDQSAD